MGPGGDMKIEYWRDARGIEVVRVNMGPASWWTQMNDALTLVYVASGEGWSHCRGDIAHLTPGSTHFVYPHEVMVARTTQDGLDLISFHVPREVLRGGGEGPFDDALAVRPHDDLGAIAGSLAARVEASSAPGCAPPCDEILALLPDARTVALGRPKPHVLEPGPVRRARLFLERSFRTTTSLDDLASDCGTSKYHLVRMFRAYHGIPPHTYLTSYRLAIARRMLATGVRGSDAAVATGFADQSHFSRSFRRMLGIAPNVYARLGSADDVLARKKAARDEAPLHRA